MHFNRVFHEINHPFWGTMIFGNIQISLYVLCHARLVNIATVVTTIRKVRLASEERAPTIPGSDWGLDAGA